MTVTDDPTTGNSVLGTRMLRKEDPALLTGEAVYCNDMQVPGAWHLAVKRSDFAHARITGIDVSDEASLTEAMKNERARELTRFAFREVAEH